MGQNYIHVGLDTVDLNGEGFHPFLKIGDSVSIGQPLMDVDLAFINSQAKSIISPIIITNDDEHKKLISFTVKKTVHIGKTVIMSITG